MNTPDKESSYRVVTSEEQILTWSRCHRAEDTSRVLPPPPLPRLSAGGETIRSWEKKAQPLSVAHFGKAGLAGPRFPVEHPGRFLLMGRIRLFLFAKFSACDAHSTQRWCFKGSFVLSSWDLRGPGREPCPHAYPKLLD